MLECERNEAAKNHPLNRDLSSLTLLDSSLALDTPKATGTETQTAITAKRNQGCALSQANSTCPETLRPQLPAYKTVVEALNDIANHYPHNGFTFQNLQGTETFYAFGNLEETTARIALALHELGLEKGDRIGLIIIEPEDFVLTFWAALRLGVIPVCMYPPAALGGIDGYIERTRDILRNAGAKQLLVAPNLKNLLWRLVKDVESLEGLLSSDTLKQKALALTPTAVSTAKATIFPNLTSEDVAFLQYTSGSTSNPKGVMVTHGPLLANAKAIAIDGLQIDPLVDKGVSWLPLYHDMGLIGLVIAPIICGVSIVFIPTLRFSKHPHIWLETMHKHKANTTFAPSFAFALAIRKTKPADLAKLDLSHVRFMGCGAEPIQPQVMRDFTRLFQEHCGLKEEVILPAYGMAEATLAITFKPLGTKFKTLIVDRDKFQNQGLASVVNPHKPSLFNKHRATLEHISCGKPLPLHHVTIINPQGEPLPEYHEGEVIVKGPSITKGYWQNPEATKKTFKDGYLYTGDLGYLAEGELYITGRCKDLIIVNGKNIHPQTIEWLIGEIPGVRKGNVVAFSRPGSVTEEIIVAFELDSHHKFIERDKDSTELPKENQISREQELSKQIKQKILEELGLNIHEVIALSPGKLPKTSSGKLQRYRTKELYLNGKLGKISYRTSPKNPQIRLVLLKHLLHSLWARLKNLKIAPFAAPKINTLKE